MSGSEIIGVVGVGVMGSAIAGRFLDQGRRVILRDMDPTKLAPLVARGAQAADDLGTLMRQADMVITSLNTAAIVEAVVFGPKGWRPAQRQTSC